MVAHYAVRAYSHVEYFLALRENVFKGVKVRGFFENAEAAVGAIEDVIDDICFCYSYGSWHN